MIIGNVESEPNTLLITWRKGTIKYLDLLILLGLMICRRLRLVDCICAGTQSIEKNGEEILVPTSSSSAAAFPCRDVLFSHPRIRLPSSVTLDSG